MALVNTIEIQFDKPEQAKAFAKWMSEEGGAEQFIQSYQNASLPMENQIQSMVTDDAMEDGNWYIEFQ